MMKMMFINSKANLIKLLQEIRIVSHFKTITLKLNQIKKKQKVFLLLHNQIIKITRPFMKTTLKFKDHIMMVINNIIALSKLLRSNLRRN